ncbi:hypothetical protein [Comamonas jiangduensis]|uniref:hypothetical protein n=1 Tax=Comamonas jiangduensis TaxID=1194168 RepID=UPI0024E07BE6|nr:hypothetical protein [Comamonas jiangduensis]
MAKNKPDAAQVAAFVLCDGSFDGLRKIAAGSVVTDVPADVIEQNGNWLDANDAAVAHALGEGAPTVPFSAPEQAPEIKD